MTMPAHVTAPVREIVEARPYLLLGSDGRVLSRAASRGDRIVFPYTGPPAVAVAVVPAAGIDLHAIDRADLRHGDSLTVTFG